MPRISGESSNTDFLPIIKYDARAGKMFRIDKILVGDEWRKQPPVEVTTGLRFVADLRNYEEGYIGFPANMPDFRLVRDGEPFPPKPLDLDAEGKPVYKEGFRILILLADGGMRHFSHTAKCVIQAFNDLYDTYKETPEFADANVCPVVALSSTVTISSGRSTNYAPVFGIEKYVPRPTEFTEHMDSLTAAPAETATTSPDPMGEEEGELPF